MAVILNIETSTDVCSVALTSDGYILYHREDFNGPNHAAVLSQFISDAIEYVASHDNLPINAIAVSLGPGSYTGLRIGLSEAKGLAYGLKVPLIGLDTLSILATEGMFSYPDYNPDTDLIVPVLDARRDEVYMAVYDCALNPVVKPAAKIITAGCFNDLGNDKRLIIVGNGAEKVKRLNAVDVTDEVIFMADIKPLATSMCALSEKAWIENRFIDIAYSTPIYLKDFMATTPKKKF